MDLRLVQEKAWCSLYGAIHLCMRTHTKTHTNVRTPTHTHIQSHTRTNTHAHTHTSTHTHTHSLTHTHTHAHPAIAEDGDHIAELERFTAGGMAGAVSSALIYPLETVKIRFALCTPPGRYTVKQPYISRKRAMISTKKQPNQIHSL